MTTIGITEARKNIFKLVEDVNKGYNPIGIVNNRGESAVLVSEQDWRDMQETLYLTSIPGFVNYAKEAIKEDRTKLREYKKGERW